MIEILIKTLAVGVTLTTPILLVALGELISERSGVLNLGIEGGMLVGAFLGFVVAHSTGNYYLATLVGMLGGAMISLIHAFASITLSVDQIVSGIGLNIVSLGATSFFLRKIYWAGASATLPTVRVIPELNLPLLENIPVLGPILLEHNLFTYLAFALVPVIYFLMFRTNYGLIIRAVGENPEAAATAGINVRTVRYLSVTAGGLMAGLGGVALALGESGCFNDNMTAGRGFIAVAVVIFGNWRAVKVMLGALIFGIINSVQFTLQALQSPIPYQFLLMLPYISCILALIFATHGALVPGALCKPFRKE